VVAESVAVLRKFDAALGDPSLGTPVGLTIGSLAEPWIGLDVDGEAPSDSLCRSKGSSQIGGVDLDRLGADPLRQNVGDAFGL
jgi:hypothetical protein